MAEPKMNNAEKAFTIGKLFVDEKDIISYHGCFYEYHDGLWNLMSEAEINSKIYQEYLLTFSPPPKRQIDEVKMVIANKSYDRYSESFKKLKDNQETKDINLKNGVFNIETKETRLYVREDMAFHRLPFVYNPEVKAESTTTFRNFMMTTFGFTDLEESTDPELLEEFQKVMWFVIEWLGYSLISGNRFHKGLIMVGEGRNGKGVLQDLWTQLVGIENTSYLDLKLLNDSVHVAGTKDKLINFSPDLQQGQQLDTGNIKSAVSGESLTANEKYKKPYHFDFTAKLIVACNELPYIKSLGAAVRERFFILPFDVVFTEDQRDPDLKYKLRKELEGIFALAVKGIERLLARGHFDPPQRCLHTFEKYLRANDTVSQWIEEDQLIAGESKALRKSLYEGYKRFCRESSYKPLGKTKLYDRLQQLGYENIKRDGYDYIKGLKDPLDSYTQGHG